MQWVRDHLAEYSLTEKEKKAIFPSTVTIDLCDTFSKIVLNLETVYGHDTETHARWLRTPIPFTSRNMLISPIEYVAAIVKSWMPL